MIGRTSGASRFNIDKFSEVLGRGAATKIFLGVSTVQSFVITWNRLIIFETQKTAIYSSL